MAEYGVTPTGFRGRTLDELNADLEARLREGLGPNLVLGPSTPEGVLLGVVAEAGAEVWAVAEGLWMAFDANAASGVALENLCALTGTERLQATATEVDVYLTGEAGKVVPAGSALSVLNVGTRFSTLAAAQLVALPPRFPLTAYALGTVVVADGSAWYCDVAGTTGSGGGPTGTTSPQVDGTARWRLLGEGEAAVLVRARADEAGPLPAPAYTLSVIETPVAGWRGAANPEDAQEGREVETDADLRTRRRRELRGQGAGTVPAIAARMLDPDFISGTRACTVFENVEDVPDADGMPSHSIEVLVEGGEEQAIAELLWQTKPAGIRTVGTVARTVVDAVGVGHEVRFSRPVELPVYFQATVEVVDAEAPAVEADAKALLKAALVAYGQGLVAGRDVVLAKASGALTALSWVHNVVGAVQGLSLATLGTAKIPVTRRQRAVFDTSRIEVAVVRLGEESL